MPRKKSPGSRSIEPYDNAALRDPLLPMLISGALRVKGAETFAGDSI
ncbi:MAG TPA: hypothetical protein PLE60_06270 [Candidatus Latescibacteria bacterium]|nr:hypothetical protein [Candidatus Latescibacterota bacterium]